MRTLIYFLTCYIILDIQYLETLQNSGPFDVVINSMSQCEDNGTGGVTIVGKIYNKSNRKKYFTGNITYLDPYDEQTQVDVDLQYLRNGKYQPNNLRMHYNGCKHGMKMSNEITKGLFLRAGYNFTGCPIPAGTYVVKDWNMEFKLLNTPTFIYGSYRWVWKWMREGKLVGCVILYIDIVPK